MNNYFSHDSNARNDDKMLELRMKHQAAGYGVYFMILERLREEKDYMSVKNYNAIAFDLREDAGLIKSVVEDFGLFSFTEDGECFYSESFNDRMAMKDEKSKRRSVAGKKGAAKRWNGKDKAMPLDDDSNAITKPQKNGNAMAMPSENIARKGKKRKEKESKQNNNSVIEESTDDNLKSFELWEQLWGFPNAIARTDLTEWIKDLGDELVAFAIEYAGRRNVQSSGANKYLSKVFDGWAQLKVTTVAQAQQAIAEREQRQSNSRSSRPQTVVKETLPEWAEEGYKPKAPEPVEEPELTPGLIAEMHRVREIEKKRLEALKNESD